MSEWVGYVLLKFRFRLDVVAHGVGGRIGVVVESGEHLEVAFS